MAQDRKQLEALLVFIDRLASEPGNEWFVEQLRNKYSNNKQLNEKMSGKDSFNVFLASQHNKNRKKARNYYKDIKDSKLKADLVEDYSLMLWYKSIYEIEKFFVHVNYQIENMLNFYLEHSSFHDKVKKTPAKYNSKIVMYNGFSLTIDVYSYSFDFSQRNSIKEVSIPKVKSLWAKFLFWAIDSENVNYLNAQKDNFNSIVNIRNEANHAYSGRISKNVEYWKGLEDDIKFVYVTDIIREIKESIINIV